MDEIQHTDKILKWKKFGTLIKDLVPQKFNTEGNLKLRNNTSGFHCITILFVV